MLSCGGHAICVGCNQSFKRLSTHIALSAICAEQYKGAPGVRTSTRIAAYSTELEAPQSTAPHSQPCPRVNESPCEIEKAAASFPEDVSQFDSAYHGAPVLENDATAYDNDDFPPAFDGFDDFDADKEPTDTAFVHAGRPDKSVLELYEKLLLLRANPLDLEQFSQEEKVHIQLLQLLNELKAPLNAFTVILNWAARANDCGYFFKVGGQPSRDKTIQKLYVRYNMKGLIPKEKKLYLPYSKRTVSLLQFKSLSPVQ